MAKNVFNTVQLNGVKSNVFDMSYDFKLSCNMGDLVPVHCQEIIPGDRITMSSDALLRLAPMIAPIMHRIDVTMHHFFVPNRLLWSNWEDFITGGQDPESTPAAPYFDTQIISVGDLGDYMGLPTGGFIDKFSALPFAAYLAIYNEYYRDQNLIDPVDYKLVDGNNNLLWSECIKLRRRAWQHDYFTSSLPFAQKGPAVSIPIGEFNDVEVFNASPGSATQFHTTIGSFADGAITGELDSGKNGTLFNNGYPLSLGADSNGAMYDIKARTSQLDVEAATINNLRVAFRLQEWFERNARGGSRYIEVIKSHFGVRSSDARLDRPEYLGGSKQPVVISEVLQTSSSDSETPQANMAGHGVSAGSGKNFRYFAEEHGYIISVMSILPKTAYSQGIPKHFSKFDRLEYAWPTFAHLGEQEVKNRELYYSFPDGATNNETWGYVPRYSEYRYLDSRIAGEFRTNLAMWHMGRIFASRPALNKSFIEADPTHRIFAVTDPAFNKVYSHIFHRIKAMRKLPLFGTPSF